MTLVEQIAERRILEALDSGALDGLPGAGSPLALDDDRHVPPELRVAYRVLKNSGFLPPEVETRRQIADAEALLRAARCESDRSRAARRLELLRMRLAHARGGRAPALDPRYEERLTDRMGATPAD